MAFVCPNLLRLYTKICLAANLYRLCLTLHGQEHPSGQFGLTYCSGQLFGHMNGLQAVLRGSIEKTIKTMISRIERLRDFDNLSSDCK